MSITPLVRLLSSLLTLFGLVTITPAPSTDAVVVSLRDQNRTTPVDSWTDDDWQIPCQQDWNDGRVSVCEVRETRFVATDGPLVIEGGDNGAVLVRGADTREIVVRTRVQTRARTEEQARAMLPQVRIEAARGRVRP